MKITKKTKLLLASCSRGNMQPTLAQFGAQRGSWHQIRPFLQPIQSPPGQVTELEQFDIFVYRVIFMRS